MSTQPQKIVGWERTGERRAAGEFEMYYPEVGGDGYPILNVYGLTDKVDIARPVYGSPAPDGGKGVEDLQKQCDAQGEVIGKQLVQIGDLTKRLLALEQSHANLQQEFAGDMVDTARRLAEIESRPALSVPAEGGEYQRGRSDERIEQFKALQKFGGWTSLTDRVEAWSKVCEVLDEVSPDWGVTPGEGSGIDKAVAAIRALSTAPRGKVPSVEQIVACLSAAAPGLWWVAERCEIKKEQWTSAANAILALFTEGNARG